MNIKGKHVLVTGGGTGIGLAIAQTLAAAGAMVTIAGRRLDVLKNAADQGAGLFPLKMDVALPDSVDEGIQSAIAQRGPVQICVANAGIAEGRSLKNTDLEFWRTMMAINLDGAFLTIQACLPGMLDAGWGRVIAISSIAGLRGLKGAPAYTASKHGLVGLVRGLAADLLSKPVTVNAICPGYVDTDIVAQNLEKIMARTGKDEAAAMALMQDVNPHGRLIAPQEVAECALWLCQNGAASVTGQALQIAGGEV
ncbi:MAG: SDR family oxidoreductase [Pseudomonadota bacterium]